MYNPISSISSFLLITKNVLSELTQIGKNKVKCLLLLRNKQMKIQNKNLPNSFHEYSKGTQVEIVHSCFKEGSKQFGIEFIVY